MKRFIDSNSMKCLRRNWIEYSYDCVNDDRMGIWYGICLSYYDIIIVLLFYLGVPFLLFIISCSSESMLRHPSSLHITSYIHNTYHIYYLFVCHDDSIRLINSLQFACFLSILHIIIDVIIVLLLSLHDALDLRLDNNM